MNQTRNGVRKYKIKNLRFGHSRIERIHVLKGSLNEQTIQSRLQRYGYCIIRDTNLENDLFNNHNSALITSHLQHCVFGTDYENSTMDYGHGTDKRPKYNSALLGVNDAIPNTNYIGFHNELVYTDQFPKVIAFTCIIPSKTGGYTPLSNVRSVWNDLPSDMKDKFAHFGIKYVRNIRDKDAESSVKDNPLDIKGQKCWQDLFDTSDADEAESICANGYGYDTKWIKCHKNGTPILRVSYNLPGVMMIRDEDCESDVTAFVNSMLGMHGSIFDAYDKYYESLSFMDRPHHSLWGNGQEFTSKEVDIVKKLYDENSIIFKWKAGDVIVADNLWWAHARWAYTGDRKLLALMGIPWKRTKDSLFVTPVNSLSV